MSLADDVEATPGLAGRRKAGLSALRPGDRGHVSVEKPRTLVGSVDVDSALAAVLPYAPRWDYLVGQRSGHEERVHWVEVHPASSTGNITEVEAKLTWLVGWLEGTPLARHRRTFVWVASGRSAFNSRSPALKGLANRGLRFAGGHLSL